MTPDELWAHIQNGIPLSSAQKTQASNEKENGFKESDNFLATVDSLEKLVKSLEVDSREDSDAKGQTGACPYVRQALIGKGLINEDHLVRKYTCSCPLFHSLVLVGHMLVFCAQSLHHFPT